MDDLKFELFPGSTRPSGKGIWVAMLSPNLRHRWDSFSVHSLSRRQTDRSSFIPKFEGGQNRRCGNVDAAQA
jgi:hypothetical protein